MRLQHQPYMRSRRNRCSIATMAWLPEKAHVQLQILVITIAAAIVCYIYLPCALLILYNYIWWVLYSGTVQFAVPRNAASAIEPAVPKILHQTWRDKDVPIKWKEAQESCIAAHPGYEYKLWTDADAEKLIADKFPWFLDTYLAYPHNIQRADVLRYFVLYQYGGIYLDLDVHCLKSLDAFRDANFTAPKTYPVGVSNDVLISKPGDPFAHQLIHKLAGWQKNLLVRYVTVMFTTGPMFVTVQYTLSSHKSDITVLPTDVYGKYNHTAAAYLKHLHGSSWHGNDAQYIFWLEHYGIKALALLGLLAVTGGTAYVLYRRANTRSDSRGSGFPAPEARLSFSQWMGPSLRRISSLSSLMGSPNLRTVTPIRARVPV